MQKEIRNVEKRQISGKIKGKDNKRGAEKGKRKH